ncbi:MAG: hypothetical protein AB7D46_05385 [Flavobacteriaceae bacterium]
MEIFKIILILIVLPFLLGFCYIIGEVFSSFMSDNKKDSKQNIRNDNKFFKTIIKIILGIIIIVVLGKVMENAGCSSNEDRYYKK